MRPIFLAAVAACVVFTPAPAAAAAFTSIWGLAEDYSSNLQGRIDYNFDLAEGEVRQIGLADIQSMSIFAVLREIVPGGLNKGATAVFTAADIDSFSATVVGAMGGASPTAFSMMTRTKDWTPSTPPLFVPQTRITLEKNRYILTTVEGRALSTGYASLTVPEPSSWALLVAGFGIAGAGFRRSRTHSHIRNALVGRHLQAA